MSLSTALNGAISSLAMAQRRVALISNNISNANTEGYTRKGIQTEAVGDGVIYSGVRISNYTRAADQVLLKSLSRATSENAFSAAQRDYLNQVQDILGTSSDSARLGAVIERFASAWRELDASPEDLSLQREVVNTADALAREVRRIAGLVENLDRQVSDEIDGAVTELNESLERIAKLNRQIVQAGAAGISDADYRDQRDAELATVAQYVTIRTYERSDGQLSIYTPSGYMLLDGVARAFEFDGTDVLVDGTTSVATDNLTGGKLEALINFRRDGAPAAASTDPTREVIRKLRDQLDAVVTAFTTVSAGPPETFASAYDNATTATGALASGFFSGTNRTDFAVNAALLNGTSTVKMTAPVDVTATFRASNRSFTVSGQTVSNVSYTGFAQSIVTDWQAAARKITVEADNAAAQKSYFSKLYADKTGVNIDEELVNLSAIQNSYRASSRLLSVIQEIYDTLEQAVR